MTTPTKEQCVQWARECGITGSQYIGKGKTVIDTEGAGGNFDEVLHAFALKVLAEKELEVLKLREALQALATGEPIKGTDSYVKACNRLMGAAKATLSTPPSSEALDEYVAARMAESEDRKDAERYRWLRREVDGPHTPLAQVVWKLDWIRDSSNWANLADGNTLDKHIDTAIEDEKVRTE